VSFLVTARKWRPQTFAEVIGQEGVCRTLQNALRAERTAHAYIFSGPRGIGKTTTARLLAKAINCANGPTPDPCNQCVPCQEISEGRSLDVLEIDGASNRGVGEIRNLRENIRFNPVSCRMKVYIIDEVHMLTIEAFNALLKTLEEPPEHALFIFATTEINRVPATILSRCQRFDFRRLSTKEISDHLRHICELENIKASDDALELLSRRADGAMRDAQSLLDQMATFAPDEITADEVRTALGIVPEDLFFRVSDMIIQNSVTDAFALVEEIDSQGHSPREFLRGLCDHFLNFLKARDERAVSFIEAPPEVRRRYEEQAKNFEPNDLLRVLAILQDAFTDIRRHPQPRLKLEMTLLRLASLERTMQIEELLAELRGTAAAETKTRTRTQAASSSPAPGGAGTNSSREAVNPDSTPSAPPEDSATHPAVSKGAIPLDFSHIRSRWLEIIDRVCEGRMPLACQLKLGRPLSLEDGVLVVGFGEDLHDLQLERLQKVAAAGSFDQSLQQTFGTSFRFRFERYASAGTEGQPPSDEGDDPLEQELIRLLGAKRIA